MPIPTTPTPLPRRLLRDVVFEQIRDAIVSGELAPDAALSDSIMERFTGASRTPVRQGLDRLAGIRLVTVQPQSGTRVAPLDRARALDALEALGILLELAIATGLPAITPTERKALAARARKSRAGSAASLFASGGLFDGFVGAAGNSRLRRVWDDLVPHVRRWWNLGPDGAPGALPAEGLEAIAAAITGSEPDPANAVVRAWFAAAQPADRPASGGPADASDHRPAARPMLRDHAFNTILAAIFDGTLEPGEELRDEDLSRWLGMSRTPIRHALVRLEEAGLVDTSFGRLVRVSPSAPDRINRALLVSGAMNEHVVRAVVGSLDDAQLKRAAGHAADMRAAFDAGETTAVGAAIREFFSELVRAHGNIVLIELEEAFIIELARYVQPGASEVDVPAAVVALESINEALQRGDAGAAGDRTHDLYALTRENFVTRHREPEEL